MTSSALRHLLERAAEVHGERFDAWFPQEFDWRSLCADAPALAERMGRSSGDLADDRRLEEVADATFRAAHVAALAVLSASTEGGDDPETLVDRLARPLDEDEEDVFLPLAAERLDEVEEALAEAGDDASDEADVEEAIALARTAWPAVRDHLAEGIGQAACDEAEEGVLVGLARVATILAAFRWMAAARANESWPPVVRLDEGS